jgi:hypothetical protein
MPDYQAKKEWKCTVCQDTMKLMRQLLLDDRIDKEISGDLEHLCEYVPRNLGKKYIDQVTLIGCRLSILSFLCITINIFIPHCVVL